MFSFLSDRIVNSIKSIKSKTILTEENIKDVLREIRIALLESDVNFLVIKQFVSEIQKQCVGLDLTNNLNPAQTVIDIVHQELVNILGKNTQPIVLNKTPSVIMLVGLQGSGKTTTCAKLSYYLHNRMQKNVLMVGADVYRPAAMHQLDDLAKQIDFPCHIEYDCNDPIKICQNALKLAQNFNYDTVIIDTAGRLQINDVLMEELVNIKNLVRPTEIFMVVDAMSGQELINVVKTFHSKVNLTGAILTKMDSDAKGGVAFSIHYLTKIPIKFIGTGEKIKNLDQFHPNRMADRILDMGDVLTLIEQAKNTIDEKSAKRSVNRMLSGKFNMYDLLLQMRQLKKMGKLRKIVSLIPGAPKLTEEQLAKAEDKLVITEILINSMTNKERNFPHLLRDNSRKTRILKGSGRSSKEYNTLLTD